MDSPNLIPALIVAAALVYAAKSIGDLTGELHAIGRAGDTVTRLFGGSQ